jgi:Tol biopolymer transport system component
MASSNPSTRVEGTAPSRLRTRLAWAVGAGALAAAVLLGWLLLSGPASRSRATILSILPAVDAPEALAPAVSPDGTRVAFVARDSTGASWLWLRALDAGSPRQLNGSSGAAYPFWSPDGRYIAFFSEGSLKVIDPWDQSVRVVASAPNGRGGAWNRDGVIVFAPGAQTPLSRVAASGGPATELTKLDAQGGELSHRSPVFLPDGQRFLYRATTGMQDRILVAGLGSPEPRIITDAIEESVRFASPGYLLFRRGGSLMAQAFDPRRLALSGDPLVVIGDVGEDEEEFGPAFSVSDAGVLVLASGVPQQGVLTWVDRTGARGGVLGEPAEYVTVALSPDGTRIASDKRNPRTGRMEIWLIDAARGTTSRFSAEDSDESDPIWSPDGTWLAFARSRQYIFRRAVATGQEEALVTGEHRKYPTSWSIGGDSLVFFANDPATQGNVWMLSLSGERVPVRLVGGAAMEGEGVVSPDGRWLAYDSDESGRYEVYVRQISTPDRVWQVSDAGGWSPKWRRDGRELFYQSEDRPAIMAAVVDAGASFNAMRPVRLFETAEVVRGYDVAGDGQRFLLNLGTRPDRAASALTVVIDWPALLQRSR